MTPYYQDAAVTIYHGDSLELLPEMRGSTVDLVVTDPPYVIGAVSAGNMASKSGGWGDMMNASRWFRDWYAMCRRLLLHDGGPLMPSGPSHPTSCGTRTWIGPGGSVGLRPAYEMVALLPMPEFTIEDRGVPDVLTYKWASFKPTGHPAEKPVPLLSRLISESLSRTGTILDPFMGSGSTLYAAKTLGHRAIGIEAEEKWCEVAANRCSQEVRGLAV